MSSNTVRQRIAIDIMLENLNRNDLEADLVAAYLEVGEYPAKRFLHLTPSAMMTAVRVSVDAIDKDTEPVHNHVRRLAAEQRRRIG